MTETERAAWATLEAGIVEDAIAAGMVDCAEDVAQMEAMPLPAPPRTWITPENAAAMRAYVETMLAARNHIITANGDGTWNHTFTPKGEERC